MNEWIWLKGQDGINTRACFASLFAYSGGSAALRICAVTRYRVWINGTFLGSGPIRSAPGVRVFDRYEITPYLKANDNLLAVEVWNHGLSTYQSVAEPPCLSFEVSAGGQALACSGPETYAADNLSVIPGAPKRNVNLGYSDYLDGRAFPCDWYQNRAVVEGWEKAVCLPDKLAEGWKREERPIRPMNRQTVRPQRIVAVEDVRDGCQVYSVNLRRTLFGDRRDANESTMAVWIGTVLRAPKAMDGVVSFPNRTWNGILGDVYIGAKRYQVTDATRGHIPVHVDGGEQLMMVRAIGTFDDLYCHMELAFPERVRCEVSREAPFFVTRPAAFVPVRVDGRGLPLPKGELLAQEAARNPLWESLKSCRTLEDVQKTAQDSFLPVSAEDVTQDAYLLSAAQKAQVLARYAIHEENQGVLWNNDEVTVIHLPESGDARRILLDFGTIHAGPVSAVLEASEGTVLDFYGFENDDSREIDFTPGLNNALRYICREGWQTFEGMARLGFRFLLITVRHASKPVRLRDLKQIHTTYSVSNAGDFACSDMMLTRIFNMCRETNILCTEDSFTDCPTYEQAFWIGDAYISALVNSWLYGDRAYQLHNASLAMSALRNTPLMNALTPTDWDTSIPMWMANWIFSVFGLADNEGDPSIVETFYDGMIHTLRAYADFITPETGLYLNSWNLLDWAPLDVSDEGTVTAQEGLLARCMKLAGDYAAKTGRQEDAAFLLSRHDTLKKHLNTVMWDERRRVYRDGWTRSGGFSKTVSVQTHLILYLMDMVEADRKPAVESYLLDTPDDFVQVGSPFILFYLYEALLRFGQKQYVFEDIRRRWGEMLKYDSTTCWEVFPGFYENGRTRSYCHSWSSSPAYFMLKYLTGLKVLGTGWRQITLEGFPEGMDWCRATYPTPLGRIHLEWKRRADGIDAVLEVPEGIRYLAGKERNLHVDVRVMKQPSSREG